ncbi:C2 domain-containing protein, partial [Phlyctochytrium arcticum]
MKSADNFRAASKTIIAANLLTRPPGKIAPQELQGYQAVTRLTGVIFDNDGEIPRPLRSAALATVGALDKMKGQVDNYKPLVEYLIYWENLKTALYFSFSIVFAWALGKLGFGFGHVIVVLIMAGGAFRRNQKRLRNKLRNEIGKQVALRRMDGESETVNWMNLFLTRLWGIFEPTLAEGVKAAVNGILEANKPAFLEDLALTTFTLGSEAPRVEKIRCYPSSRDDILIMDWDLSFVPIDEDETTKKQRESSGMKNSKIELTARVGKGVASIPLPVLVTEIEFTGTARIQLKFMTTFPFIKTVEFGFMEMPHIDFIVRPLKGMDLMDTPGLSSFLTDTIAYYTKAFVVDPNFFPIDVEQLLGSALPADKPVGVLRVSLYEAKGLRNMELAGKSDPYARIMIGGKIVSRSKHVSNSLNPVWDETFFIIITKSILAQIEEQSDELKVEVLDWNNLQKDKFMGATQSLHLSRWVKLLQDEAEDGSENMSAEERNTLVHDWGSPFPDDSGSDVWKRLFIDKWHKGEVRMRMAYLPVNESESPDATESLEPYTAGILEINIHQGKELSCTKHGSPECSIEERGVEIFRTPIKKKTNNPLWDAKSIIFVKDLPNTPFVFRVWNGGQGIGSCIVNPGEHLAKVKEDWFKLSSGKDASGRLQVTFKFTPVDLEGGSGDRSKVKRRTPAGLLRTRIVEAKGLANVEMMGKSDPYVKLDLAGRAFGATHVKNNTLDPKWDEIFYAVCYSRKEHLTLSLWDWNDFKKDRSLGQVEFLVSDLIKAEQPSSEVGPDVTNSISEVSVKSDAVIRQEKDGLQIQETGQNDALQESEPIPAASAAASTELLVTGLTVPRTSTVGKQPRQKGFLHFEADFFPAIEDKTIYPERKKVHTIRASVASTPSVKSLVSEGDKSPAVSSQIEDKTVEELLVREEEHDREVERAALITNTLREFRNGILSFRLHDAQDLTRGGNYYVELVLDDGGPIWTSKTKKKTSRAIWEESIDQYISQVTTHRYTLRLKERRDKDPSGNDPIFGQWSGFISEVMGRADATVDLRQGSMADRALLAPGNADIVGKLRISVGYVPVAIEASGHETLGMGILHCDILDARNLEAVDSSGTSDPYCQLYLNGAKVHKTKTLKKTLNPEWNETVSIPVESRLRSNLEVRVKDWNSFSKHVTLGTVHVPLARLAPNEVMTKEYQLEGAPRGTIKLRTFFDPQAIESR